MMNNTAGRPRYFARWTGHAHPFRPREPIEYAVAEQSRTFNAFIYDDRDWVTGFDKWVAHATPHDPNDVIGRDLPRGQVFFESVPAGNGRPGRILTLNETEPLTEYFRARVHPDGSIATLERVRRERTIHHEYTYWEDGSLKEVRFASGGKTGYGEFDRAGNMVNTVVRDEKG